MVDIHCHILPNVDDGAKSWKMAEEMCKVAAADGISHIVCSPHSNDQYKYDRAENMSAVCRLKDVAGEGLEFSLGCDFHFSYENIQALLKDASQFVIDDTDYLLVELSDFAVSPAISESLARLCGAGIRPIITHPERNMMLQRSANQVLELAEIGCLIQVTANSFTGHWGEGARKMTHWLMEQGVVHVVASDAHDPSFRPPVLSLARKIVSEIYGKEVAETLFQSNPEAIVRNHPLSVF